MKLERSMPATIGYLAGALVLGAAAFFLIRMAIENDGWKNLVGWPAGILCGLISLGCLLNIFMGSARTACPVCDKPIALHDRSGEEEPFVPCQHCGQMIGIEKGEARMIPEGFVAEVAGFRAPLPETFSWPAGCVVCGQAATRQLPAKVHVGKTGQNVAASVAGLALTGLVGVGFIRTGGGKTISVEVPHCDRHEGGVALAVGPDKKPQVLFRSLPVMRAFCKLNGVEPVRHEL